MDRTERVELTVLCMIQRGNQLLLQNRLAKDWSGYTFPGGHVEPGESFVDAVVREVKEETGLNIKRPQLCGVKQFPIDGGRYIVLLFQACKFSGQLQSSDEGPVEWVERERLNSLPLVEDFHELLRVFDSQQLWEFQYTVDGEEWNIHLK